LTDNHNQKTTGLKSDNRAVFSIIKRAITQDIKATEKLLSKDIKTVDELLSSMRDYMNEHRRAMCQIVALLDKNDSETSKISS
jgi:hypoxanthine-guanine phosphoribosyltransferase